MNRTALAALIDHTCLAPDAGARQIDEACDTALEFGMRVCVAPVWVPRAVARVRGRSGVVTVAGFPHGNTTTAAKCAEARGALEAGAGEVDMVMHLGALRDRDEAAVSADVRAVAAEVRRHPGSLLKVIIETALLSREEILLACRLVVAGGADFVKTSTGFAAAGATVENVRLMRAAVPDGIGIKAAGGIRTLAAAMAMIDAGATRIGASASRQILREAPQT
jgi:deoxyribose-phosphate aldolase